MGAARDRIWVLGDGVDDGVEHSVNGAIVDQRLRVVLAVHQDAVCFWRVYSGGVAHVMLERIVDVEVDRHGRDSRVAPRRIRMVVLQNKQLKNWLQNQSAIMPVGGNAVANVKTCS